MRPTKRNKRSRSREAEYIPSKVYSAALQSEGNATQSEETDETDEEKEKEREQRSRMHSVVKTIKNQPPWIAYERKRDPRILNKTPFVWSQGDSLAMHMMTRIHSRKRAINSITLSSTDRNNVPRMEKIAGAQKLQPLAEDSESKRLKEGAGNDTFRMVVASMPCAYLVCRGKEQLGSAGKEQLGSALTDM
jgi:hypothetical protein